MSLAKHSRMLALCLVLGVWFTQGAWFAQGTGLVQEASLGVAETAAPSDFERGRSAYERGAYQEARSHLRSAFTENPAHVSEKWGSVAYWLGKTYEACGQPDSMRWAWKRGTTALKENDRFEARLFDARLRAQWSDRSKRTETVEAYLALLSHAGPSLNDRARPVLHRHVAQLLPVLPDSKEKHVLRRSTDSMDGVQLKKDAGTWLVSWWRSKDPLPATTANERVEEHLRRVRYATDHFFQETAPANFDARGTLHVRYGAPSKTHTIPFRDLDFLREVVNLGVGVSPSDFPDNVIWQYSHVGEKGKYLFVEGEDGYRLGEAMDLLPEKLKRRYSAGNRSQNRAYSSLVAMRYIFEHLAMHYRDPANVYPKVVEYFNMQRAQKNSVLQGGTSEIGKGVGSREVYQGPGTSAPGDVANRNLRKAERGEETFVQKREKEMPRSHSSVATADSMLPVQVRPVRYLTDDGATRVELLWGNLFSNTETPEGLHQVKSSLVAYGKAYDRRNEKTNQYRFSVGADESDVPLRTMSTSTTVDEDLYHLAMQWNRYDVRKRGGTVQVAEQTGKQAIRFDSLQALSADPGQLEMSDLRPMRLTSPPAEVQGRLTEAAAPYPFRPVSAKEPLLLDFEVYHLTHERNDRTRYTVEYEVVRQTEQDVLFGLFQRDSETRTATTSTYTGTSRNTSEYVLLEWTNELPEKPQPTTVTVRVTDEVTGQEVQRSLDFRLLPPDTTAVETVRATSGG